MVHKIVVYLSVMVFSPYFVCVLKHFSLYVQVLAIKKINMVDLSLSEEDELLDFGICPD